MTTVEIPQSELHRAWSLWAFVTTTEDVGSGELRLRSDGRRRRWYGTNPHVGMVIEGGADSEVYDVGLSWALLRSVEFVGWHGGDLILSLEQIGETPVVRLSGPGGTTVHHDRRLAFPEIDFEPLAADRLAGSATVGSRELQQFVEAVRWKRQWDDEGKRPPGSRCWLTLDDDSIVVSNVSDEIGRIDFVLHAPGADTDVSVLVNPDQLQMLCNAVPPDEQVRIELSRFNADPVVFVGADWCAYLMPFRTPVAMRFDQLEKLLGETLGPVARVRDHDGDYPLRRHGLPVYGRVHVDDADTMWFQVFAVLAGGIEPGLEVFRELNDLNTHGRYVRLFLVDGQILAEVDLLADTLDADELYEAIERITAIADEVMPTLTLVLGGEVTPNDADRRWAAYRTTVIEAQVTPGRPVTLNGAGAVTEWPFPGTVHVITGWNPNGRDDVGDDWHRNVNRAIAVDVTEHGGRFVDGVGRSPNGDHAEESLVVWGLDRATVRAMGSRANQDAIYEVDADHVTLVSCVDDRTETWSRRTA